MPISLTGTGSPRQGGMRGTPGGPSAWNYRHCARRPNAYLDLVATVAESGPEERGGDYDEKAYSCGHSARADRRGNGQRDGF